MTTYYRIFEVSDVTSIYSKLVDALELAEKVQREQAQAVRSYQRGGQTVSGYFRDPRGLGPASAAQVRAIKSIIREWESGLNRLAKTTARQADERIRRWIDRTRSGRPPTGSHHPGLRKSIISEPILSGTTPTGRVGIANLDILSRQTTRDPSEALSGKQYGPYWRAQEEGFTPSGRQLAVQKDKRGVTVEGIRGFFTPGKVPASAGQFRAQSVFLTQKGGAIMKPGAYEGRFFLLKGSTEAWTGYEDGLIALQDRIHAQLTLLLAP